LGFVDCGKHVEGLRAKFRRLLVALGFSGLWDDFLATQCEPHQQNSHSDSVRKHSSIVQ
jgi:hypothetical protein